MRTWTDWLSSERFPSSSIVWIATYHVPVAAEGCTSGGPRGAAGAGSLRSGVAAAQLRPLTWTDEARMS